ncbi:hypothetical protein SAURM35S_09550 [Streptomyces aurantiogriseus]
MATYNLTVQLTAQANSLISGLRSAADAAQDLGRRTRELDRRLDTLDASTRRTARQIDTLGAQARTAATRLGTLSARGSQTGRGLRRAGDDAGTLERSLRNVGRQATALTRLLAGGALVLGTGQLVEEGNRYQRQMNIFQAVTGATAGQMQRAAWMANQLGNDLTLPTTTAADAAEAMVELAKAGFRTDQAISATRASLQLASAAGVNAADSARYLGDIMDQFGLGADQAARASDILAATANNASGGIIDIYYAMRYAGPVAAGLGVSMEDAASAVGMLGKAGILGQTAGTALRGMMANLAAPTKEMRDGLEALGIEAWDAQGRFKGLLNNNGTLNTATRNGQQLYQSLTSLSDAAADASVSAYALAQQNGRPLTESLSAARAQMTKARAAAVEAAQGYGLTRAQAEAVADSLGLLPSKVSLLLETEGMDSTLADLLAVQAEFDRVPKKTTIQVDSLSAEAQKDLRDLGFKVETIPGTRQIRITAPTKDARGALQALIDQLSATPGHKTVKVDAATVGALASLKAVETQLIRTPNAKSVTISAPTAVALKALEDLGFKVQNMPNGKAEVTVPVQPPLTALGTIQGAINNITGTNVGVGVFLKATAWDRDGNGVPDAIQARADGAVVGYFADGGLRSTRRENHVAQIAPAGSWRVWAEPETQGEAYVPLAASKRPRSKAIVEEVVRRFGGDVTWYASGGLSDWSYSASGGSELVSVSTIRSDSVRTVKRKGKEVEVFDLSRFEKNLDKAVKRTERWRRDLRTVARRAGQDVADALEAMGEDGVELAHKMATGSSKYLREMASDLERLGLVAKVSLGDFTAQLKQAVKDQSAFEQNLAKLAALGYGDLAARLAEQGDEAAEDLAAEAVKDRTKAKKADDAAKAADRTLAAEDLADLLDIISAIKSSSTGIHQVADTTGLEEDRVIEVGDLGRSRIQSALGSRATKFLDDLAKATKGLAYANGGVWEPGVYSSPTALIKFAEASTGGEAFIPLASAKRPAATAVLADVARRFGLQLSSEAGPFGPVHTVDARPAGSVQVVVVRERQPLIGTMPVTVSSAQVTPQQVGAEVMRRLRNAQRGARL